MRFLTFFYAFVFVLATGFAVGQSNRYVQEIIIYYYFSLALARIEKTISLIRHTLFLSLLYLSILFVIIIEINLPRNSAVYNVHLHKTIVENGVIDTIVGLFTPTCANSGKYYVDMPN